jgi:hypothetical protein
LITAILVLSGFFVFMNASAVTINLPFNDGFEGDLSAFTPEIVGATSSIAIVNNNAFAGTHSLFCVANGVAAEAKGFITIPSSPIVYVRAQIQLNQLPVSGGDRTLVVLTSLSDDTDANAVASSIQLKNGNYFWQLIYAVNNYYSYVTESTPSNPQIGKYYEVQILRDLTNQKTSLWVNGVNLVTVTGLSQVAGSTEAKVGFDYVDYTNPATSSGYFDDFSVDTNYIPLDNGVFPTPTPSPVPTTTPTPTVTPSPTPSPTPPPSIPLTNAVQLKANATVTGITYTTNRLSVTITKNGGVNGIEATIAKTTLPNISPLRVFINNVQKTFTYVDNGNQWIIDSSTT